MTATQLNVCVHSWSIISEQYWSFEPPPIHFVLGICTTVIPEQGGVAGLQAVAVPQFPSACVVMQLQLAASAWRVRVVRRMNAARAVTEHVISLQVKMAVRNPFIGVALSAKMVGTKRFCTTTMVAWFLLLQTQQDGQIRL